MLSIDATDQRTNLLWLDNTYGPQPPWAVFDFDGVVASPVEDLVYKLADSVDERPALAKIALRHGISPDIYDTHYLRHLVLQAVLADLRELPAPGPLFQLARQLSETQRPFFVLTARSGRAAISRLMAFLDYHRLVPQEVFCVGRVPKGRQLALVAGMAPKGRKVVYFEDTIRHARNSRKQDAPGVETVHILWEPPLWGEAEALVRRVLGPTYNKSVLRGVA